jgi:hypothetical protein
MSSAPLDVRRNSANSTHEQIDIASLLTSNLALQSRDLVLDEDVGEWSF